MTELLTFAIVGLGVGAVYAALGVGLVVTFTTTGVLNFAVGAMGVWSAYVYAELRTSGDLVLPVVLVPDRVHLADRVAFLPAIAVAVVTAIVLGVLVHVLVFRPLRTAPPLAKVVASAGVMLAVQALVALRFGVAERVVAPILPERPVPVAGMAIPADRLWLAAVVVAITLALVLWFRYSVTGLAMRASAENEFFVALARFSPNRLATLAWALSSGIVGFVSVLAAPVIGLNATDYLLLVVPALACALAGRLTSIGWTAVAGLALGAVNSEITYLSGRPWWPSWAADGAGYAIPFLAVVTMLALRGKSLPTRALLDRAKLPAVPRARLTPTRITVAVAVGVAALLCTTGSYRFGVLTSMIFAIMALSFVVVTGLLGQVSLAQAVIAGAAGFVLSKLTVAAGIGFPLAPLLAALAATGLGVLAGVPALRIRGTQLAVVTLAAAVAIEQFVFRNAGLVGLVNPVPSPELFGLDLGVRSGMTTARLAFGLLCLVVLTLCAIGVANLARGATGRRFLAVRSNERASAAVGVHVARTKLLGFAIASFLAGLSGCLLGYSKGSLSAESFTVLLGISLLLFAYLGGITSVAGAVVAGTFAPLGITYVIADRLVGASSYGYQLFAALALIVTAIANPDGIVGKIAHDVRSLRRRRRRREPEPPPPPATPSVPAPHPERQPSVLAVDHLTVRFAGVTAVDDVSLRVPAGQIVGLIGANGAGKTTLIDAIGGFVPSTGRVAIDDTAIDTLPPHSRAHRGVARTWQSLELFTDLTVRDNLLLAAERPTPLGVFADLAHPNRGTAPRDPEELLDAFGLGAVADAPPDELSLGQRKLVNIARALAGRPKVLLLDEPAAGLSRMDTQALGEVLRALADASTGVLLVEHDIDWVLRLCDVIYVLDFGKVIAHGSPREIRADPAVRAAYLGTRHTDLLREP